jgi:hypothetical protein
VASSATTPDSLLISTLTLLFVPVS